VWRTATYVKSTGDGTKRVRRASKARAGRLVEQLVGSLLEEQPLVPRPARGVTARQRERDEQEVLCAQATTDVGQNHAQTSL